MAQMEKYRWFYFSGRKLTDASGVVRWFGVNIDIEDLQNAEDALRSSEAALRVSEQKLNSSSTRSLPWRGHAPRWTLEYWNKNLIDFVGLKMEDIFRLWLYQAFHPDDVERMRETWEEIVATKAQSGRRSHETVRWRISVVQPSAKSAARRRRKCRAVVWRCGRYRRSQARRGNPFAKAKVNSRRSPG